MLNKRTYIFGSMVIIILIVGLFSFRLYASTNEQEIEKTITEFFNAFYTVTPDTIDLIIPNMEGVIVENKGVTNYENYAKSTYAGLYTENFYKTFLLGDRYMIMAPQIASDNELTISFKSIKLTPIESNDKDKYYDFTVEIVVKDNVSGTEEILVNKGQVSVKQDFFKYKIHAIKFFEDKLVSIVIGTETYDIALETHYLTLKDITDCPFYRPELTIEMQPTPFAMTI